MNHILFIPDLTVPALISFVMILLFLWILLEILARRNRPHAENRIVGHWKKGSGLIVIRFYSTADHSFEARLVYPKLISGKSEKELIIIRDLRYKNGSYVGGKGICLENGEWLNCEIEMADENTLKVRKKRGLSYRTQTWYRHPVSLAGWSN